MPNITNKQIIELLDKCGFKHAYAGYMYAFNIIKNCIDHPEFKKNICETYGAIGFALGVSGSQFERSLRHAIDSSLLEKMTCKEFICRAIDSLTFETEMCGLNKNKKENNEHEDQ